MAERAEAPDRATLPLVIKVGGSLAEAGRLQQALTLIAKATRAVIVVPGGGAFVDKVRDLQKALRFDDVSAHRLAMLGMHQMAEVFIAMAPRLKIADSLDAMADVQADGGIPVWVPLPMMNSDPSIPTDWSITSDGLAARLAELMGGAPLLLLKSVDVASDETAEDLAREGVVDAAFPGIVGRAGLAWCILGPAGDDALITMLAAPDRKHAKS